MGRGNDSAFGHADYRMTQEHAEQKAKNGSRRWVEFRQVSTRNLIAVVLIITVTTLVAGVLPRVIPGVQMLENWLSDFRFTVLSKPQPIDPRIVIAAINEETLATMAYRSPVDRGFLKKLLEHLALSKVRAVGIDILFDQPTESAKDEALRKTITDFPAPVIIASTGTKGILTAAQQAFLTKFSQGVLTGDVNLIKDSADGTVRGIFVQRPGSKQRQPGFATALVAALGQPVPKSSLGLAYRPPPNSTTPSFKVFPAHVIPLLPKKWFAGKIVLIGADLPLIDRHRTVFSAARGIKEGNMPGVLIHAHALSQLLDDRQLPGLNPQLAWAFILSLAMLGMLVALLDTSIFAKGILFVGGIVFLWSLILLVFRYNQLVLPFLTPSFAFTASFVGGIAYLGHHDRVQKKFIQRTFSRYLSPAIVELLIARPSELKVGGERRELTYLFTDLTDFTSLTEKSNPEVLVELLNKYIDGMCSIVFKHDGTVDKIIGDAVCAFFGAPVDQLDHCQRAVACALELDRFAQEFAARQAGLGMPIGVTRIGVHSGIATIGNFGGNSFFDYTAFGDMVNTAARLESINKHLGTRICISEITAAKCAELKFRPVGNLMLKGKSQGLAAVEPVIENDGGSMIDISAYMAAFEAMKRGETGAIEAFERIVADYPGDRLAAFHLQRLKSGDTGITIDLGVK